MNHILIFVPTVILLCSIIVYIFLKKEAESYIERVRAQKNRRAGIITLELIRGVIAFFGSSRTSKETEKAIQAFIGTGELKESAVDSIAINAIPEISSLYGRIEEIRRMDQESGVMETLLKILVMLILLYGVIISLIQYILLAAALFFPDKINITVISQMIIGATIIFSASAIFICLEVFRKADIMVNVNPDESSGICKESLILPSEQN